VSAVPTLRLLPADPDGETITSFLHNRPENTRQAYRRDVRDFRAFYLGALADVSIADLQHWITAMQRRGLKGSTIRRKFATVAGLLKHALATGRVEAIPALNEVQLGPRPNTVARRILSREQVQRLIDHAPSERAGFALRLLYFTGLRVSELCALRWADLSEQQGRGWATIEGKGGKTRVVGIPQQLWADLWRWHEWRGGECIIGADRFEVHDWVQLAAKSAGLRNAAGQPLAVSPHWLRHCHITHARMAGCDWEELAEQAGHSSPDITRKVYAHLRRGKTSADYLEEQHDAH